MAIVTYNESQRGQNVARRICRGVHTLVVSLTLLALASSGCSRPPESENGGANNGEAAAAKLEAEWQAEYDKMAAELPLSPPESQALEEAFTNMQNDLSRWMEGDDGQRLIDLEARLARAARNRNLAEVKAITDEAGPIRRAFEARIASHQENLLAALTPENRARWESHAVSAHMLELMEPLALTAAQIGQIETQAGVELQRAQAQGQPNPPAAAFLELEKWVEQKVLTPQQREAYAGIKQDNPMRSLTL